MSKRQKITTISETQKVMRAVDKDIQPPSHMNLREIDLIYFKNIYAEMAKIEITPHKLEIMVLLARAMTDLECEMRLMQQEGCVIETAKGRKINPRKAMVSSYVSFITSFRRTLSIHGRALGGEKRDIEKRRGFAKDIERQTSELYDDWDGLIARPVGYDGD